MIAHVVVICPLCGREMHRRPRTPGHGTIRYQVRSSVSSHLATVHSDLGSLERSEMADRLTQDAIGRASGLVGL